jgi:hypothetical protein
MTEVNIKHLGGEDYTFGDLDQGDYFVWESKLLIRISACVSGANCIALDDGVAYVLAGRDPVTLVHNVGIMINR